MAKYTQLQTRKLISAYGGVGSIIETIQGALLIKDFDKWLYFIEINKGNIDLDKSDLIEDRRLFERLKYYFPELQDIIKCPVDTDYGLYSSKVKKRIANAQYFPKWLYCSKCNRFKHIKDWFRGWKEQYQIKNDDDSYENSFRPPKCYECYATAKNKKNVRKEYPLEQVRFVMIAPNGSIEDIPWQKWTNLTREENENEKRIKFNGKCCEKQDLRYIKDSKNPDFSAVRIKCQNPECPTNSKHKTLAGMMRLRVPDFDKNGNIKTIKDKEGKPVLDNKGKEQKVFFKPVIRTSNSVYYPLITNSLYLPTSNISREVEQKINTLYNDAEFTVEQIERKLQITKQQIEEVINPKNYDFVKEVDYRLGEYKYLTTQESPEDRNLSFESIQLDELDKFGICQLLKVGRLKMSSVQTGYSRQEPIDKDLFADYSMNDFIPVNRYTIKPKYTSSKGNKTNILPGIESFGEGIFVDFDKEKISEWFNRNIQNNDFKQRLDTLSENAQNSTYRLTEEKQCIVSKQAYLAKFILIHTFLHILIKELEFLTGYPATSLSERLYINENDMDGILIYTIAGAEGSYGGLVAQARPDRFIKIIKSALARARDCASDPICYHSEGQGIGGLNLASCYSCGLLPETSCEEFNSYLDRRMLIDKDFGFYQ